MKLTEVPRAPNQRVCVFGGPKSGKTELVGRLAEKFNLLWFDFENGFSVLLKLPTEWQERIELVRIPDTRAYPIAVETALKIVTGSPLKICHAHGKASCPICLKEQLPMTDVCLKNLTGKHDTIVVFDSMTQLANSVMNWLTRSQKEGDEYKPEWSDYRNQGTVMDRFLSEIQQATYNVVCITHELEVELEDGRKRLVPVAGTRNFSANTAKYFDHIVYCQLKNKKHNFGSGTTYDNSALTGSRTDVSVEGMETASLLPIFDPIAISDGIKKAQANNAAGAAAILAKLTGK